WGGLCCDRGVGEQAAARPNRAARPPSPAPPQARSAPPPIDSFSALVDRQVSQYEKNVVEAADAMPAEKFDFTPASLNIPGSSYKDVRTFAQLVKHTATANYRYWTTLT